MYKATQRVVWRLVCEALMSDPVYHSDLRIALIVDSSLDEIAGINARTSSMINDWMLPDSFTLIYATADSATASIANHLISLCDKQATVLLKRLKTDMNPDTLFEGEEGEPYTHIRNWQWTP
jgi:hypothetical protein